MKYRAVCFDIDGTLYPVREMHKRLTKIWLSNPVFNIRYSRMRKTLRKIQGTFEEESSLRPREARILGCSEEELNRKFYSKLEKEYRNIKPHDGVRETFEYLKKQGVNIGVFSDFPLFDKLKLLGVEDLVDYALSSDDIGFLKPSVHPFEVLLYKLGVKPSEALYVGDEFRKDIVGARSAGMDAYLIQDWKSLDGYLKEL